MKSTDQMLKKAKWIWVKEEASKDTYGEFYSMFYYREGKSEIVISADSNYALFVNGRFVTSGQYPDFPHYKVYDRIDITQYCKKGENHLAILVWYYGVSGSSTYYAGNAGLCFEVYQNEKLCLASDANVLSRLSKTYENGLERLITYQMGYSFHYDATKEDDWINGVLSGFCPSRIVSQRLPLYERPIEKLLIAERIETQLIKTSSNYYLYDFGKEEVGYLTLQIQSEKPQKLVIAYGEHIADGSVRRIIHDKDFSVEVTVKAGITEYTNYFRRLGLRYLEIWAEDDIDVGYISVLPCHYPLKRVEKRFSSELWQQIYDTSVRTLELCMHDHYEDCPWREQALYTMDSRNQMLCGYYAFQEYRFARQNLYLMSKDRRKDGLLSICTPCDFDLVIPSFSLHYYTEVLEYTEYSGDTSLAQEILPKLQSVMEVFLNRMENGLVRIFPEPEYWNFYEWTDDLTNEIGVVDEPTLDAALNCLLSIALQNFQKICELLDVKADYGKLADEMNRKIRTTFYNEQRGLYVNRYGEERYSELVNALAVLCGAAEGKAAKQICEELVHSQELTKASLSMMCFKYDALLKVNREKYRTFILKDIEEKYKKMLDAGATSFWETELGEADFWNTGSLCHGWSAMPVYYFNILGLE